MKKRLLNVGKLGLGALVLSAFAGNAYSQTVTTTFNFTGGLQNFTVPCGVDSVFIQAWGAQGGSGADGNSAAGATLGGGGGLGGYAEGSKIVATGDVLNIMVGGQGATPTGGFNGGANGGSQNAGGGGGASDVRFPGTAEADRIITAGGGGGGGRGGCESIAGITGGTGGAGGGGEGVSGADAPTSGGVAGGGKGGNFGAVQGASGGAGVGCAGFLGVAGGTATTGTGAAGGAGQSCCCFSFGSIPGGGGGGGGQVGGGGGGGGSAGTTGCSGNDKGAGGGGGGGSSYTGGVLNGATTNGIWLGNGMVTISYEDPTPAQAVVSTAPATACAGDTLTYVCNVLSEATFYTWTVSAGATFLSGQNTNTITVIANSDFTVDVYGVNGNCSLNGPAATTVNVTVNALPAVTANATDNSICEGESTTLTGGGADSYSWSNGVQDGVAFTPAATTTYQVIGTDLNGCENSATVTVTVNPLPNVNLTATQSGNVCGGQDITLTGTPAGGTYTQISGPVSALTANVFNAPQTGSWEVEYDYTDGNGCSGTDTLAFNVNCMVGLEMISGNSSMNVYPNPSNGHFTISSKSPVTGTIRLHNELGQLVFEQTVNGVSKKEIEIKDLTPGVYQLTIESDNQTFSGKLNITK